MIVEFPECAADNGPFSGPKHLYAIEIGTDADANDSYAMRTGVFVSFKLITVERRCSSKNRGDCRNVGLKAIGADLKP
jgi:hypothetical protein